MRKLALVVLLPGALAAGCSRPVDEPPPRDLTLLVGAESTATPATTSARELDRPDPEPRAPVATGTAVRPRLAPIRAHAEAAAPSAEARSPAPVPVPAAEPAPTASPAPAPATVAAGGAGTPLEPGQSVTIVPAGASAGPGQVPQTELLTPRQMDGGGVIIIDDDRCIPGRGELLPGLRLRWR
jgi:hypothetical protein